MKNYMLLIVTSRLLLLFFSFEENMHVKNTNQNRCFFLRADFVCYRYLLNAEDAVVNIRIKCWTWSPSSVRSSRSTNNSKPQHNMDKVITIMMMMMIVTRLHVVLVMVMVAAAAVAMVNHCQAVWLPQSGRWGAHVSVVGASAARGFVWFGWLPGCHLWSLVW